MPTCGITKLPSANALISSLTPVCSLPKTNAILLVKSTWYKLTASSLKCVVKMDEYLFLRDEKHSSAFSYCRTVSHLAALDELFGPHFLCRGIFVFKI